VRPATQRVLLLALVIAFAAFTTISAVEHGYLGFWEEVTQNTATLQVLIDLSIVAFLALIWMYRDSRVQAMPFVPYALLTVVLGSFGPLGYLLHRTWRVRSRPVTD
jgi:hypothetical protein